MIWREERQVGNDVIIISKIKEMLLKVDNLNFPLCLYFSAATIIMIYKSTSGNKLPQ